MTIRDAVESDATAVLAIYNPFITGSTVTFEEKEVTADEMRGRIRASLAEYAWLVAEDEGAVLGYAYGSRWRERCAYRTSVETTIYMAPEARGRGIGKQLYTALLDRLQAMGMHLVIAGIALPNEPSVRLHEALGFAQTARFPEVGFKFGRWLDVGYWTKIL